VRTCDFSAFHTTFDRPLQISKEIYNKKLFNLSNPIVQLQ